jgi:Protein of unknown function (DUF4242)
VPLYMDTHERVRAITMEGVTRAYERSLEVQAQHGARYLKMWLHQDGDDHGRLFCLVEAPSREAVTLVHLDAHGMLPNEIHEVIEASLEVPPALAREQRSLAHA